MKLFREITLDRLGPGMWRVTWERRGTDGWTEQVKITDSPYGLAKVVPVLLGLGSAPTAAERARRIREIAREQGWQEPDITVHPAPEDPTEDQA